MIPLGILLFLLHKSVLLVDPRTKIRSRDPITLIRTVLSLAGTQVLIKSKGRHLFEEALIDKTQTDCKQTQQHSRKMASFPLFQWENERGYLAQRAAVRLISENGICLKAEIIFLVSAATNCYNLGPYPAHCVSS